MGLRRAWRRTARWALRLLERETDTDTSAVAYYLILYATFFSGQTRLDLVGPTLRAAEASGDVHRRFVARLIAWIVLHFDGRLGAAHAVSKSIGKLGERYEIPEFEAWARFLEGTELQLEGSPGEALELLDSAEGVLDQHGDILGALCSRAQQQWTRALLAREAEPETARQVAESARGLIATILSRRLLGSGEHSWSLAAAALALSRLDPVPRELWRQVRRLHRRARRHCTNIRSETPLYHAVGALLSAIGGHPRRVAKRLQAAERLARQYHNADGLVLTYRLGVRLFPPGSPERQQYVEREQELLARIKALPRLTFEQILDGELGPSPWD